MVVVDTTRSELKEENVVVEITKTELEVVCVEVKSEFESDVEMPDTLLLSDVTDVELPSTELVITSDVVICEEVAFDEVV